MSDGEQPEITLDELFAHAAVLRTIRDDLSRHGLSIGSGIHRLPRRLFDQVDAEEMELSGGSHACWTKERQEIHFFCNDPPEAPAATPERTTEYEEAVAQEAATNE